MNSDVLDALLEYINAFEQDLHQDYINASNDTRFIIAYKLDVIEEIIDYAETNLGLYVRDGM